jgi:hypothetical protein
MFRDVARCLKIASHEQSESSLAVVVGLSDAF